MTDLANINEIKKLVDRGAHFFVGHSGGKDSCAMYEAIIKMVPGDRIHVVHADLGKIEYTGVKEYIRDNIDGRELLVAQAIHADGSRKDFFSAVRARRASLDAKGKFDAPAFPSSAARFCTSDLKTGPIWKVIKAKAAEVGADIVVNCVGIRAEESKARAKKINTRGTLNANKKNSTLSREAYDWWPIAYWSVEQVWDEILGAGKMPFHVYDLDPVAKVARGNERMSCVFCIFGSRNDLANGYRAKPELFDDYLELERDVRGTMFADGSLADRLEGIEIEINPGTNLAFNF